MKLPEQSKRPLTHPIYTPSHTYILIVDLDSTCGGALSQLFQNQDYAAYQETNAAGALHRLREHLAQLVILDLQLPDFDGMCLLQMIRRLHPDLPILVLTGNDSVDTILKALQSGVRGYLTKPVEPQAILACARQILKEQQALQSASSVHRPGRIRPAHIRKKVLEELEAFD